MIDMAREAARVRCPVLAISAVAWAALAATSGMHVLCPVMGKDTAVMSASSMTPALTPSFMLVAAWALMLVAMMSPLLIGGIHHVRFTSLARRRTRSIALFVSGYGSVWMMCGAALTGAGFVALALLPESYVPAAVAGLVACIWQASPLKQHCLNKCHQYRPLRAFGPEADIDALRFGWTHGVWCAGSCSALMLVPLLLPTGHLMAMAAVSILIFCERLEEPEPPAWKARGLRRAWRMMSARIRIYRWFTED